MAQARPKPEETTGGIDDAVLRLEQAFQRLEQASRLARAAQHSLKEDNAKLNHLLHEADGEIGRLREAVFTVSERLDRTIQFLEQDAPQAELELEA